MASDRRRDDEHSLFTSKTPHFFKVILHETIRDGILAIPIRFVRKYGNQLSSPIKLEVPSGAIWQVELTKADGRVLLHNGWREFAEHYSLEYGSFVVFRYEGNDHFQVLIFDRTAAEIEYPHSRTEEDDVSASRKNREKPDLSCPLPQKKMRTDPADEIKTETDAELENSSSHITLDDHKGVGGISACQSLKKAISSHPRKWTATEKARATQIADAFKSTENPNFMVVMQPTSVSNQHMLCLPSDFAREFLTMDKGSLTLCDSAGKTWPAKYYTNPKYKSLNAHISGGWRAFVEDNHLNIRDICVFELIKHPEILLKVHIYPAVENESKACTPQANTKSKEKSHSPCPLPQQKMSTDDKSSIISPGNQKTVEISPGQLYAHKSVKTVLFSSLQRLTATKKAHILEVASTFKDSRNPVCLVVMQPSFVSRKYIMVVPGEFAREFLKIQNCNVTLCNSTGKTWSVKYYTNSKYRALRAYLYGGWRKFVEDNHINVGDICAFELIEEHPKILMKVAINRVVENASKACKPQSDRSVNKGVSFSLQKLNDTEKANAVQIASAFKSTRNPTFTTVMKPSFVCYNYRMCIRKDFARKFLPVGSCDATLLNSAGKTWPVKFYSNAHYKKPQAFIYGGWRAFVEDNHLDVRDICVFELIKQHPEILMKVVINPVVENASNACRPQSHGSIANRVKARSLFSDAVPNRQQSSCLFSSSKIEDHTVSYIKILDDPPLNQKTKEELEKEKSMNFQHLSTEEYGELNFPAKDDSGRMKMEPLTPTDEQKACIGASGFKTSNPSFRVVMRQSYVLAYAFLHIPEEFAKKYLKKNGEVILRVKNGRTWILEYERITTDECTRSQIPSRSWRPFVEHNGLKVGDVCIFELISEDGNLLEVVIQRKVSPMELD